MSEKIKKNEKAKKQTWRAGNMLYPVPAVMVSLSLIHISEPTRRS